MSEDSLSFVRALEGLWLAERRWRRRGAREVHCGRESEWETERAAAITRMGGIRIAAAAMSRLTAVFQQRTRMIASACRCAAQQQQQQQQQRGAGVEIDQTVLEAAAGAEESVGMKGLRAVALLGAGATGLLGLAGLAHADESEHGLSAPDYPWPHNGILSSYDHSSIRRGHQVNIIISRFWILFIYFFPSVL